MTLRPNKILPQKKENDNKPKKESDNKDKGGTQCSADGANNTAECKDL